MMIGRLILVLSLLAALASPALADSAVVVLGIRSVEGDDDVANDITEQLRSAARGIEGWNVSNTAVSMAQMSLAHGCDEIDASCLAEIAKGLGADRIIYGTLRRTTAREDFDYALNVNLFAADTREIMRSVDDTIPRTHVDFQSLASRADRLVARLASITKGGAIDVQANVPDAQVTVNGQIVGTTRDGALRLEGLQPGRYRVVINKDGYTPFDSTVSVVEGEDTSIAAVLAVIGATTNYPTEEEVHHGHHLAWLGWTLIGVSAASLIGLGVSLGIIEGINNDKTYNRYRDAVAQGNAELVRMNMSQAVVKDVCTAAKSGAHYGTFTPSEVKDVAGKCNTADTFEVLQWVFLGTAVASGAAGTFLVLTADGGKSDDQERGARGPSLVVLPVVGPQTAMLNATLRF
jgi:hypothetical protein